MSRAQEAGRSYDKIAVLRANALGDFIFAVPALEALRARFPQAEIVLLGKAWHRRFLEGRPGPVDRVVVVPPYGGVGEAADAPVDAIAIQGFFAAMARERFDLAIQLHGGGRYSNPFVRRLGADMTIGLKTPDAASLDRWVPYVYFHYEYLRYLEVVALVGARPVCIEPRIEVTDADRAEAAAVRPPTDRPLIILHPGATDPRRRWPPAKFAAVGDALAATGARIAVTGTDAERAVVDEVVGGMVADTDNLCGRLSLGGLTGLLARSALVIANDTGPLHLAAAVGTATIGIYWCGNLFNGAPITRTRHRPAVSWRLHCPVCDRDTLTSPCEHRASFVAEVPTDEVIAAARSLLDDSWRHHPSDI